MVRMKRIAHEQASSIRIIRLFVPFVFIFFFYSRYSPIRAIRDFL
jgi:hypothetical protein